MTNEKIVPFYVECSDLSDKEMTVLHDLTIKHFKEYEYPVDQGMWVYYGVSKEGRTHLSDTNESFGVAVLLSYQEAIDMLSPYEGTLEDKNKDTIQCEFEIGKVVNFGGGDWEIVKIEDHKILLVALADSGVMFETVVFKTPEELKGLLPDEKKDKIIAKLAKCDYNLDQLADLLIKHGIEI